MGQVLQFAAFLGIMNILNENFLVFVEEVEPICIIDEYQIFECKKVQLIHMSYAKQEISKEIKQYIERIEKILSFGHYFSFNYPLTLNLQKLEDTKEKYPNSDIASHFELQYFWNHSMIKPLINQEISHQWHLQLIQGYVKDFECDISDKIKIHYYLVSRRSIFRSGTRCNHRGIDTDGNTANFVEHESIYVFNQGEKIVSHVQIRGSLPILWEQQGLKGKISLAGGEHLSLQSFKKHFTEITQYYGKIFSVSLMAEGRSGEKLLTSTFKSHYDQAKEFHQYVQYDTFDIKHHCKGGKYENINPYIIKKLTPISRDQSYLLLNTPQVQNGVIRTNCKSSLDRTNIFQSKIELNQLQIILLDQYGFDFQKVFGIDALEMMENQKLSIPFIKTYKIVWSQNGDNISQHYAGTNALTSHATKTGSAGLFGKLRGKLSSIKRLYEGTFQDSHKQEGIDLILGRHVDSQRALKFEEELKEEAFRRESQFLQKKQVSVFINTWSLKKFQPKNTKFILKNILNFQNFKAPDIIVLCFQKKLDYKLENLDLNCQDKTERQFWVQLLQIIIDNLIEDQNYFWNIQYNFTLLELPEYIEVDFHSAGGLMTIIMAQKVVMEDITSVEHDDIITGSGKGTAVIKMTVKDTKFCFINAHLSHGQSRAQDRIQQVNEIHQKAFQKEGMSKYKREKIEKSEKIFLIGDLNFRVNIDYFESIRQINKLQELQFQNQSEKVAQIIQYFLGYDQLTIADKKGVLQYYKEAPINFLPTYKYVVGQSKYDLQKEKIPSWCDRILMWNNEQNHVAKNIQEEEIEVDQSFLPFNALINQQNQPMTYFEGLPLFYNRREVEISDHRPVCAYYIVTVKEEDAIKKGQIFKDLVNKKMNIIAQQTDAIKSLQEYWQNDDEENPNNSQKQKIPNILKQIQNQNNMQNDEEEEDDDEDEDIQGEYDKNQDKFFIDQTKLNNTTTPKYKYSDEYSEIKQESKALNLSNNEGELEIKNDKQRFKQAVDSAKKKDKSKIQQDDNKLTKQSSELGFSQNKMFMSEFKKNKLLNQSLQYNKECNRSSINPYSTIITPVNLNQSSILPSYQNQSQISSQSALQKQTSHQIPYRNSEVITLTKSDTLIRDQVDSNKNQDSPQMLNINYLNQKPQSSIDINLQQGSPSSFSANSNKASLSEAETTINNAQQGVQEKKQKDDENNNDVQIIKFDELVIINDYSKKK